MIAVEFQRLGDPDAVRHANALVERIDAEQRRALTERARTTIECDIGQTTESEGERW